MDSVEIESEYPAIKALGPLFKLTEVHLWDDGSTENREASRLYERNKPSRNDGDDDDGGCLEISPMSVSVEDLELAKEMNALGLPLSFNTNKEMRGKKVSRKGKTERLKNSTSQEKVQENTQKNSRVSEVETVCSSIFNDLGHSELSCSDVAVDVTESRYANGELENSSSSNGAACDFVEERNYGEISEPVSDYGLGYGNGKLSVVAFEDCGDIALDSSNLSATHSAECCFIGSEADNSNVECTQNLMEHNHAEGLSGDDRLLISESAGDFSSLELLVCDETNKQKSNGAFGDWEVYWDSFYSRNYFYDTKSQASTWDPPPGMEHLIFDNSTIQQDIESLEKSVYDDQLEDQKPNELPMSIESGAASDVTMPYEPVELCEINGSCQYVLSPVSDAEDCIDSPTEELIGVACLGDNTGSEALASATDTEFILIKSRKEKRRMKLQRKLSKDKEGLDLQGMPEHYPASICKYWCQRYLLFSRFDDGIRMDEEGWFSVTPESIARHHASRCASGVIIDAFTGVGGDAIQFAKRSAHVIAIDIDPKKIDYARHNASVYGVDSQIEFINGDFFLLVPQLKADTLFLSPPWGGPDYLKVNAYDINTMLKPHDGSFLFNVAKKVASRIVMFLPRNVDLNQLAELSLSTQPPWSLEVEKNFLNGKLKAITAYFENTAARESK